MYLRHNGTMIKINAITKPTPDDKYSLLKYCASTTPINIPAQAIAICQDMWSLRFKSHQFMDLV